MELHEVLKAVTTQETNSKLELWILDNHGMIETELDDYGYIMSIGYTLYNDAKVVGITAIDDTLIIKAQLDQDK